MTSEQKAAKLEAVADWFTDCKNLNLEKLPTGLIEALRDGATALRSLSLIGSGTPSLSEARTGSGQEPCGEKEHPQLEPPPHSQGGRIAGWQLIESAPKDGTPVRLKWNNTTVEAIGRWCPAREWPKPFATDDWRDVSGDDVLLMPTHWRPL